MLGIVLQHVLDAEFRTTALCTSDLSPGTEFEMLLHFDHLNVLSTAQNTRYITIAACCLVVLQLVPFLVFLTAMLTGHNASHTFFLHS